MGFADQLSKWTKDTQRKIKEVIRESAAEVERRVVERSPVDTGRFRDAWESEDKLDTEGVISITNDTEYGPALEYGHSQQAPHGMVHSTAQEWPVIVEEAVRKAK